MIDSRALGPEEARHRATKAGRAGLRIVSLLDQVLELQPPGSCLALRTLKSTLRAAQLNPLSLIETPVLHLALTQLQIIDDGGDPRVANLTNNLEIYLALRRIRSDRENAIASNGSAHVPTPQRQNLPTTVFGGVDLRGKEVGPVPSRPTHQDSPFINHDVTMERTGFSDTVIESGPMASAFGHRRVVSPFGATEGFADTVQDFPETVPAAFA